MKSYTALAENFTTRSIASKILKIILLSSFFLVLAACGGGGGGGGGVSSSSSSSSSAGIEQQVWVDAGSLEDHLVFSTEVLDEDREELMSYDLNSGEYTTLAPQFVLNGKIASIYVSPDKKKVAYIADQVVNNKYEIFITNGDGSVNINVSPANQQGDAACGRWASDSQTFIFCDSASEYKITFDGENITRSQVAQLNGSVVAEYDNGDRIYYRNTDIGDNTWEFVFYSFESDSTEFIFGSTRNPDIAGLSPDGENLLFQIENDLGVQQFYNYHVSTKMLSEFSLGQNSWAHIWRPGTTEFIYLAMAGEQEDDFYDLMLFDTVSQQPRVIFEGANDFSSISRYEWSNDNRYFAYLSQQASAQEDLHIADVAADTMAVMSVALDYDQPVTDYAINSDLDVVMLLGANTLLLTDVHGDTYTDLSTQLPAGGVARGVEWVDTDIVLIEYRRSSTDKTAFRIYDLQNNIGRDIFGSEDGTQGFRCVVNVNRELSPCGRVYDET